ATDVTVTDLTPAGLTFVSNGGSCSTPFPCSLGTLAPGASAMITTTYLVPSGYTGPDPIMNEATVSSPTPDPEEGNNTNGADVPLFAPAAALTVTKTNGVTSVVAGTQTTYTITVTNGGPSDVSGVRVTDPLPAGVASATWSCTVTGGGSCTDPTGMGGINTTVSLEVNAGAAVSLVATGAPGAAGSTLADSVTAVHPPG